MSSKPIITSEQCRAARELLNWSQKDLSERSGLSQSTISNFEREDTQREIKIGTLIDLVDTFEEEGIRFNDDRKRYGVWIEFEEVEEE